MITELINLVANLREWRKRQNILVQVLYLILMSIFIALLFASNCLPLIVCGVAIYLVLLCT